MDGNGHDGPRFDSLAFRQALGAFVTGVTIVTTCDAQGGPAGLTANSFNSVSLDPPMVLWSLALDSASMPAFRQARFWAVHVLSAEQEALSVRFASREAARFEGVSVTRGPGGIPLLDDCAARFVCRAAFEYEGGDHAIFLGQVEAFTRNGLAPLAYHQGRYAGVVPAAPPPQGDALAALERRGLLDRNNGRARLSPEGRMVAQGFAALAEGALADHELATLRQLLTKLG